jgi:hypothetical protein
VEKGVEGVVVAVVVTMCKGGRSSLVADDGFLPKTQGKPCSANHPIVAEGTMSVKGNSSSVMLKYFKKEGPLGYIAMSNVVWTGAQTMSASSPTNGNT